MKLEGATINFLGDSITQGVGVQDPANVFPARIQKAYRLKAANNYGIGGTRFARQHSASVNAQWDYNFCDRAETMEPQADCVVVFGGTNDFGHGDAPLGTFADRSYDTFYGATHTLMQRLINRYPDCPIIFLTPLHRRDEDNPLGDGYKAHEGALLIDYVNVIIECARYYALPVLDLYASSGIQPNIDIIRQRYCPDSLHPNDAGHAILAHKIGAFLYAL
jgi:lysophospholipase L1-like esterase